jgi:hypothetical protein
LRLSFKALLRLYLRRALKVSDPAHEGEVVRALVGKGEAVREHLHNYKSHSPDVELEV